MTPGGHPWYSASVSTNSDIRKEAQKRVQALQEQYGLEEVPANVTAALASITARGTPDPAAQGDAAVRKMEMACLAAWARGEVTGPDTPESLERRAKQADNLARMFEKKGDAAGKRKQVKRAEQLRKQAADAARAKEAPPHA